MNKNSKIIKKQKNSIDNYFGKKSKPIFFERLQEEISNCDVQIMNESDAAGAICANEIVDEKIVKIPREDWIALQEKNDFLEKQCSLLTAKNGKLVKDNCALKKMLDAAKNVNMSKDLKIQNLESMVTQTHVNKKSDSNEVENYATILFSRHEQYFERDELIELRSIGKGQRRDSIFMTKCLQFLYKSDLGRLAKKCVGERKLKGKSTVTPSKKVVLKSMLCERVESEGVDAETVMKRCGRMNRLIGDGIYTISKRPEVIDSTAMENEIEIQAPTTINIPTLPTAQNNLPFTTLAMPDAFNFVTLPYYL